MKYPTTIPFSGFYNSVHDSALDDALEQMFTDRDTGCNLYEGLFYAALDKINWHAVHTDYAREYCANFASWLELDMTFDEMDSPREYNFTTDRIFAFISEDSLKRAYDRVDTPALRKLVRERFTSRDGFISFYEPNLDDWPTSVFEWDVNQIGTLMMALADQECSNSDGFECWDEYDLMEQDRCNGDIDDMVYKNMPNADRLFKIFDYLELRAHREGVTA